jgi:thiamine pyrophosphate-dependent acetolactate synthase large subunit-like protein
VAVNALEAVAAAVAVRPDDLCVSSLGTATSALRAATDDAPHLYLGGAMGSGLAAALGVAERCPDRPVMAILGDGELLMGAGSLWSLAGLRPQNLLVLVLDDGRYVITGGQPLIAGELNAVIRGFSTISVSEAMSPAEVASAVELSRPRVVVARVSGPSPSGPSPFVNPRLVPARFLSRVAADHSRHDESDRHDTHCQQL